MRNLFVVVLVLCVSGCGHDINYTKVPISKIISDKSQEVFIQVFVEDDHLSDMAAIVEKTKKIEYVKNLEYVRSDDLDYMSFWIPIAFGANGESTKTLSVYYDNTQPKPSIGWVINGEWADKFPRHFMKYNILLDLCNDTSKEFVSAWSYGAVFDGWPSTVVKAQFSHGKCIKSAIPMAFNSPYMTRHVDGYDERRIMSFLLESARVN